MSDEINRHLQELANRESAQKKQGANRPLADDQARNEYATMQRLIQEAVSSFRALPLVKQLGLTIRLDGPIDARRDTAFLLHLWREGVFKKDGRTLLIELYGYQGLDNVSFALGEWDSNLTENAVRRGDFSGYPPGEEPKKRTVTRYKAAQVDDAFGWVAESRTPTPATSFAELMQYWLERLVKSNT